MLRGDAIKPHRVSMLLRGVAPFSPEQVDELQSDGVTVRTRAGVVMTVDVPLDAVERVLAHDFIRSSELSGALYPEATPDASRDD